MVIILFHNLERFADLADPIIYIFRFWDNQRLKRLAEILSYLKRRYVQYTVRYYYNGSKWVHNKY